MQKKRRRKSHAWAPLKVPYWLKVVSMDKSLLTHQALAI
jgi:hypothetical protein